jgi:transforming growth factor-beta-induced protein
LLKLLSDVDLKSTISGDGPFTIFAPTNAAFEKLDPNLVSTLNQVTML